MSQQGNEDHILESAEQSVEEPAGLTRDKRYLELLSPTREGICIYLLSPRYVSSDVWSNVLKDICWKR